MAQKSSRSNLKLFHRGAFSLSSFYLLFIVSLIIMGVDFRHQFLKKIKSEISILTSPVAYLINLPTNIFNNSKIIFATQTSLTEKIKTLEQTNYSLSIQIQENELIKSENKILRNTL